MVAVTACPGRRQDTAGRRDGTVTRVGGVTGRSANDDGVVGEVRACSRSVWCASVRTTNASR